jgi:hypothetical protein
MWKSLFKALCKPDFIMDQQDWNSEDQQLLSLGLEPGNSDRFYNRTRAPYLNLYILRFFIV